MLRAPQIGVPSTARASHHNCKGMVKNMTEDEYVQNILRREAVDTSLFSPVRSVQSTIEPTIREWAGTHLRNISPSGSFAKGTADKSGTDIDLFISLFESANEPMRDIYQKLFDRLKSSGYSPRKQNVSINVTVNGYDVDLVPARQQNAWSEDHSLYRRRADTWTKTNVSTHISHVQLSGCSSEIRILKLWRNQKGLDFPSFYLELSVIAALIGKYGTVARRVMDCFRYLQDNLANARIVDPANTANIVSDDLSTSEKNKIAAAAQSALSAKYWSDIVK